MTELDDIDAIFGRMATKTHTEADIETLRKVIQKLVQVGKYNLNIGQGHDIQIGDRIYQGPNAETIRKILIEVLEEYAQHFQQPGNMIFQAPPLPPHFVPRPEVTDILKARLLKNEPTISGILVISAIHGLGGIGKSTIAEALAYDKDIQERFPDGILWVTLGQQPEILSLISGWIQTMRDYDFRPTTVEAASTHLRTLLQDKSVLLVVDDVWEPEHAKHFKVGGPHCQVLITTRRADVADEVGAELHQMDVMTPEQALELLAARLQRPLDAAEHEEALSLAEAVGYLPLALELTAVRLARGMSWMALSDALEQEIANLKALEGSPRRRRTGATTLEACFNLSLNSLRNDDEEAWHAFVWLGMLPEDVQIAAPMVATLWNMEQAEASELLELLWNDALLLPGSPVLVGEKEYPAYRLHDLLHDITRKLLTTYQPQGLGLTLQDAHATLLERYKQRTQNGLWHTLVDDGYIHAHLTWHFQQAKQEEQIHTLLREETKEGCNGWYQTCDQLGQAASFLADVNLALQLATQTQNIGLQCRYALITASFNSMARNIPSALMVACVEKGVWTSAQALAYACRAPDLYQQVEMLVMLAPYLSESLRELELQRALMATRSIEDERERGSILEKLTPHLSKPLLQEALRITQTIKDVRTQAGVLAEFPPHLSEPLLREMLIATQKIGDEWEQAKTLRALVYDLPEPLLSEALTAVRAFKKEYCRIEVLDELIPLLKESGNIEEALAGAQMLEYELNQVKILARLAPYLSEPLLSKALTTVRAIKEESDRIEVLQWFIPRLAKRGNIEEILAEAQMLENESNQAKILAKLAPYLSESLLSKALTTVRTFKSEMRRTKVLYELILRLADLGNLEEAITEIQMFEERHQDEALLKLAYRLIELENFEEVLMVAQLIKYQKLSQVKLLVEMIEYLPESLKGMMLKKTIAIAQLIEDTRWRIEALARIAPHLPDRQREKILSKALAEAIVDKGHRIWEIESIAPHLSKRLLSKALIVAQKIDDMKHQAEILAGFVPHLPELLQYKALATVWEIEDEYKRSKILGGIVSYLADSLLQEALRIAMEIKNEYERAEALAKIATHLSEPYLADSLLQEALRITMEIKNDYKRAEVLAKIATHLSEPLLKEVLVSAQRILNTIGRDTVYAGVARRLAELGTSEEALVIVKKIQKEWIQSEVIAELAHYLPKSLLNEVLLIARTIKESRYRVTALAGMIPHLPISLRQSVLQEALETKDAIEEWESRVMAWADLLPYLSESQRNLESMLWEIRRIEDEFDQYVVMKKVLPILAELGFSKEALSTIEVKKKPYYQAQILAKLTPYLSESLLQKALVKVQLIKGVKYRSTALAGLALRLSKLSPVSLLPWWQELLEKLVQHNRESFLFELRALTPIIAILGGKKAVAETFRAIQNVGRWWP